MATIVSWDKEGAHRPKEPLRCVGEPRMLYHFPYFVLGMFSILSSCDVSKTANKTVPVLAVQEDQLGNR